MNRMHVVIAGTGVAGLETALALRSLAEERITLELVGPERELVHRPLAVAEPFRMGEVRRFPPTAFAAAAGAELRHDAVGAVDTDRSRRWERARKTRSSARSRSAGRKRVRRWRISSSARSAAPSSGSCSPCRRERPGSCRSTSSR